MDSSQKKKSYINPDLCAEISNPKIPIEYRRTEYYACEAGDETVKLPAKEGTTRQEHHRLDRGDFYHLSRLNGGPAPAHGEGEGERVRENFGGRKSYEKVQVPGTHTRNVVINEFRNEGFTGNIDHDLLRGSGVETSFKVADPVITEEKRTENVQDSRQKGHVIMESKERPKEAKLGGENRTAEYQLSEVTVNRIFGENPYATNGFSSTNTYSSNHFLSTNTHVETNNLTKKEKPKEAHAGNISHVPYQSYGQVSDLGTHDVPYQNYGHVLPTTGHIWDGSQPVNNVSMNHSANYGLSHSNNLGLANRGVSYTNSSNVHSGGVPHQNRSQVSQTTGHIWNGSQLTNNMSTNHSANYGMSNSNNLGLANREVNYVSASNVHSGSVPHQNRSQVLQTTGHI